VQELRTGAERVTTQDALNSLRLLSANIGCLIEAMPASYRGDLVDEIRQGTRRVEELLRRLAGLTEGR
jgi:hypothetical protein